MEQHLEEHNELVKVFGQKTSKKINSKKNKNYYNNKLAIQFDVLKYFYYNVKNHGDSNG